MSQIEPAQRIPLINRCARTLSSREWTEIDFLLRQFGLPTTDRWDGPNEDAQFHYVRDMLGGSMSEDGSMLALDDFLHAVATHDRDDEPWATGVCRVFITHLWAHRAEAVMLQQALESWGIDAFVAHRDIAPGAEWVRVILAGLNSCDALVAMLREGFKESDWCDQEVGVALGRGVPVLPIGFDLTPYGLFGMFQAQSPPPGTNPEKRIAETLVNSLLVDKRTTDRVVEALVNRLGSARSFDEANRVATRLARPGGVVSRDQLRRIRDAQATNSQLNGGYKVEPALVDLESRLPDLKVASPPDPDEEPF